MLESIFTIQLRKYEIQPSIIHGSCIIESNDIIIVFIYVILLWRFILNYTHK